MTSRPPDEAPASHEDGRASPRSIVGIGGSAGALAALKSLLPQIPRESGLSIVIVVHLSPEHESHLDEILQPHAGLPVLAAADGMPIEADHVYVIPPGVNLSAVDSHFQLSELESRAGGRAPVDHFLRTLAAVHGGRSAAVILTGSGSDGALGVKAIRESGGVTLAQAPAEAEFDGMPTSAIATGCVDRILPLTQIAPALLRWAGCEVQLPAQHADEEHEQRSEPPGPQSLQELFACIRTRNGRDFSHYKRSTLLRRIGRRMQLAEVAELPRYVEMLRSHPDEVDRLSDDLLVTVTSFFRDREVFAALESDVVPAIFDRKQPGQPVRVWSVGCATGEEAYSLAILLLEEAARRGVRPDIQIFASDLHDASIERARKAFFPGEIAADVSAERLQRYFEKQEVGYRIRQEVRDVVLFAPHNLLSDPPFSRMDLISCRNLLIYLRRDAQRKVLTLFHYALLDEGGMLVLGTSESIEHEELFHPLDRGLCIFEKAQASQRARALPVFSAPFARAAPGTEELGNGSIDYQQRRLYGGLHERVLELYAPPSVLVSADDRVLHLSEHAGRFFSVPGGVPTTDVLDLVHREFRKELRWLLDQARGRREASRSNPFRSSIEGELRTIVLEVRPVLDEEHEGGALVLFHEQREQASAAPEARAYDPERERDREVEGLRQRLHDLIEQYESNREEMRASNEELQSSNEELRSTLEELETSKEELQSINEELQTVNQESRHKVDELAQLTGDLQNLLAATDIATLFLDRELRILRFTPAVSELFNVRPADQGRPLSDITHRLGNDRLERDVASVLSNLEPVSRELQEESGRWFLTRLLPYRSTTDSIDGVVITFVDITERKAREGALREAKRFSDQIVEMLPEPLLVLTADLRVKLANTAFYERFRLSPSATEGRKIYQLAEGQWDIPELRTVLEDLLPDDRVLVGQELDQVFDGLGRRVLYINARRLADQQLILLSIHDITERREMEESLEASSRRSEVFLATLSHELRNPLASLVNGLSLLERSHDARASDAGVREMMGRQLRQLTHLVDDLLEVSRISQGKLELRRTPVELAPILRETVEDCRESVAGRALELDLPEEPLFVEADPIRLAQIVSNLLQNACRFTSSDGHVGLEARREGDQVVISVRDDGAGIAQDQLPGIFEMFAQGHFTWHGEEMGLGVGLALVREIVEMHGGTIEAQSEGPGHGSRFVVRLPAVAAPAPAERPEPAGPVSGLRVLVVDDNADNASSLSQILADPGNELRTVFDGQGAVRAAAEFRPDVVLLDIGLPDLDGYEVARRIRADPGAGDPMIVAVTGWGQAVDRERSRQAGFDHHLVKPTDMQALWRLLAQARDGAAPAPESGLS